MANMINMNEFRLLQYILIKWMGVLIICSNCQFRLRLNLVFEERVYFLVTFRSLAVYTRFARGT